MWVCVVCIDSDDVMTIYKILLFCLRYAFAAVDVIRLYAYVNNGSVLAICCYHIYKSIAYK